MRALDSVDLDMVAARFHPKCTEHPDGRAVLWIGRPGDRRQVRDALDIAQVNGLIDDLQELARKMRGTGEVRWIGIAPDKCQVTGVPITDCFIDGAVRTLPGHI